MKFQELINKYRLISIIFVFIFISTTALSISGQTNYLKGRNNLSGSNVLSFSTSKEYFTPVPVLKENSLEPDISAESVLVVDMGSGVTLFEKGPDRILLPASTTKIITALVAMDYYPRESILRVGKINIDGQKMGLVLEEEISADALIRGLLISSANDAAEVLAQNYPGGRGVFVDAMNKKAKELNLNNSYFSNPSGLDAINHKSTARDLVRASSHAVENPYFLEIVSTKETLVKSIDGKIIHRLVNINELIGTVDGVLGVKTGWTENALENLITYIERDGKKIMLAVLGSHDRFIDTRNLIDWVFINYEWREVSYP